MLRRVIDDDTSMTTTSRYDDDLVRTYVRTYIRTNRHAYYVRLTTYVRTYVRTLLLLLRTTTTTLQYVRRYYYARTYVRTTHWSTFCRTEAHVIVTCRTPEQLRMYVQRPAVVRNTCRPNPSPNAWAPLRTLSTYVRLESLTYVIRISPYVCTESQNARTYGSTQYVRRTP